MVLTNSKRPMKACQLSIAARKAGSEVRLLAGFRKKVSGAHLPTAGLPGQEACKLSVVAGKAAEEGDVRSFCQLCLCGCGSLPTEALLEARNRALMQRSSNHLPAEACILHRRPAVGLNSVGVLRQHERPHR